MLPEKLEQLLESYKLSPDIKSAVNNALSGLSPREIDELCVLGEGELKDELQALLTVLGEFEELTHSDSADVQNLKRLPGIAWRMVKAIARIKKAGAKAVKAQDEAVKKAAKAAVKAEKNSKAAKELAALQKQHAKDIKVRRKAHMKEVKKAAAKTLQEVKDLRKAELLAIKAGKRDGQPAPA